SQLTLTRGRSRSRRSSPDTLAFHIQSRSLRRCGSMFGRRALIGDAPDRPAGVVGDEQCAVLGDREGSGAAPDLGALLTRGPEARREILVIPFGFAVFERHARDLVAGWYRPVPRAFDRDKQAPLVFGRKLVALVEDKVEQRGMRLEQQIGGNRRLYLVGRELCEAGLRVLADIGVRPAVEPTLLDAEQIIRRQVVAETVALLPNRPQFAGLGMKA